MKIDVVNVRSGVPDGYSGVYVGRGKAPAGFVSARLGNPLPVRGKGIWTPATEAACAVITREEPSRRNLIDHAWQMQGFEQGEAARLYLDYLRARCRENSAERRAILTLARQVKAGEAIALGCWCTPAPCHADAVRRAVLGYARRLA